MKIFLDHPTVVEYAIGPYVLKIYCQDGKIACASWVGQDKGAQACMHEGRPITAKNLTCAGICEEAEIWIEQYLFGAKTPPISFDWFLWPKEASKFRIDVWKALSLVPFGTAVTYLSVAKSIGRQAESARCVAGAIGENPFSPFIPCHRVIGSDGSLTGFAAGIEIKKMLLSMERAEPPIEFGAREREKFFFEVCGRNGSSC